MSEDHGLDLLDIGFELSIDSKEAKHGEDSAHRADNCEDEMCVPPAAPTPAGIRHSYCVDDAAAKGDWEELHHIAVGSPKVSEAERAVLSEESNLVVQSIRRGKSVGKQHIEDCDENKRFIDIRDRGDIIGSAITPDTEEVEDGERSRCQHNAHDPQVLCQHAYTMTLRVTILSLVSGFTIIADVSHEQKSSDEETQNGAPE